MHRTFVAHGRWYFTLTVMTAGTMAWVAFLHAGSRLNDTSLKRKAGVYGALALVLAGAAVAVPTDAQGEPIGAFGEATSTLVGLVELVLIVFACAQLGSPRRAVYPGWNTPPQASHPPQVRPSPSTPLHQPTSPPPYYGPTASERAVADALAARQRRAEARKLAANDPALARDLNIGRPDRPRHYDDGGLVDVNGAPADALMHFCGLTREKADELVVNRQQWRSGFSSLEEVFAYIDLTERDVSAMRDRAIVLPS